MSEKNLPIKLVLQRTSDTQKNQGGGGIKFFCEVTKELQDVMTEKFEGVLSYYESVFQESECTLCQCINLALLTRWL